MAKVHGPRIKAARGYAGGISTAELGKRIGVSESTIKRWEGGDPSLTVGYRIAIANVCGVPAEFMEHGWETTGRDELAALISQQNELLAEQSGILAEIKGQVAEAKSLRDEVVERTIDPAAVEATRALLREALERRADQAAAASKP